MAGEVVYKDRDNSIDLQLSSDTGVADLSAVTKIELVSLCNGVDTIDSITSPGCFDLTTGNGILILFLGQVDDLKIGKAYMFNIIIYDSEHVNGVNWGSFTVTVC